MAYHAGAAAASCNVRRKLVPARIAKRTSARHEFPALRLLNSPHDRVVSSASDLART